MNTDMKSIATVTITSILFFYLEVKNSRLEFFLRAYNKGSMMTNTVINIQNTVKMAE